MRARRAVAVSAVLVAILALGGCEAGDGTLRQPFEPEVDTRAISEQAAALRVMPVDEAYREALAEPDPLARHLYLAEVYARVDETNFDAIRTVFEADMKLRDANEARVFGNLWAKVDPAGALSGVMQWTHPKTRIFASDEIMSVWVQRSNAEAARKALRELASELPEGVVRGTEQSLTDALARHGDLETLLAVLNEVEDADHRRRMVSSAMLEAIRADRSRWLDWAARVAQEDLGIGDELADEMVLNAIRFRVNLEFEETLEWYDAVFADTRFAGDALAVISETWSRKDPEACLAWLRARPESEQPGRAIRALAFVWLQQDPQPARETLRRLVDEDPGMSGAIFPLVQFMMVNELEEAMTLAQRVEDSREKDVVLKQGLMRWARRDPAAVDAYIEAHPVSDPVRKAVRVAKQIKQSQRGAAPGPSS